MFQIGDKISYPMHGAGIIENIENKTILEENRSYYVLRFSDGQMKVLLPVDNAHNAGLRDIIGKDTVRAVIEMLKQDSGDVDTQNWNKRFRENQDKLKTGDIFEVAGVVRALIKRQKEKGLSSGEKRMMNQAMTILVSELAMSSDEDPLLVRNRIMGEG